MLNCPQIIQFYSIVSLNMLVYLFSEYCERELNCQHFQSALNKVEDGASVGCILLVAIIDIRSFCRSWSIIVLCINSWEETIF